MDRPTEGENAGALITHIGQFVGNLRAWCIASDGASALWNQEAVWRLYWSSLR